MTRRFPPDAVARRASPGVNELVAAVKMKGGWWFRAYVRGNFGQHDGPPAGERRRSQKPSTAFAGTRRLREAETSAQLSSRRPTTLQDALDNVSASGSGDNDLNIIIDRTVGAGPLPNSAPGGYPQQLPELRRGRPVATPSTSFHKNPAHRQLCCGLTWRAQGPGQPRRGALDVVPVFNSASRRLEAPPMQWTINRTEEHRAGRKSSATVLGTAAASDKLTRQRRAGRKLLSGLAEKVQTIPMITTDH